jgi:hypothetical protein
MALYDLGRVALAEDQHAEAQRWLRQSVVFLRQSVPHQVAWVLTGLGYAARGLDQRSEAWQCLGEALRISVKLRGWLGAMMAPPLAALLLADRGEGERAVEVYALASRYPHVANSRWYEDVVGRHIAAIAETLPAEVVAAAQERGRTRDLWATAEELLAELEGQ